jgi:hypothetical protein
MVQGCVDVGSRPSGLSDGSISGSKMVEQLLGSEAEAELRRTLAIIGTPWPVRTSYSPGVLAAGLLDTASWFTCFAARMLDDASRFTFLAASGRVERLVRGSLAPLVGFTKPPQDSLEIVRRADRRAV